MTKITYNRRWIERRIAERLGFTYTDMRLVFDEFENLIREVLGMGEPFRMTRLFTMYLTKTRARKGYNAVKGKHEEYPETHYVRIKGSKSLLSDLDLDLPETWDEDLAETDD